MNHMKFLRGVSMKNKVTLSIPILNVNPQSEILWSLRIPNGDKESDNGSFMIFSEEKYHTMEKLFFDKYYFEKVIFDFYEMKIHIISSKISENAIRSLMQSLTIHSSYTSKLFCLFPPTKPKAEK